MTVPANATAELDAAQVAHDLDELIMEDDESVDGETQLEGSLIKYAWTDFFNVFLYNLKNLILLFYYC